VKWKPIPGGLPGKLWTRGHRPTYRPFGRRFGPRRPTVSASPRTSTRRGSRGGEVLHIAKGIVECRTIVYELVDGLGGRVDACLGKHGLVVDDNPVPVATRGLSAVTAARATAAGTVVILFTRSSLATGCVALKAVRSWPDQWSRPLWSRPLMMAQPRPLVKGPLELFLSAPVRPWIDDPMSVRELTGGTRHRLLGDPHGRLTARLRRAL
jgi:hypothetical protein